MHNMLKTKKFFAALFLIFPVVCGAQPRAAFGPVERVDAAHQTVTVLGQTFVVNAATQVAIDGEPVSARLAFQLLATDSAVYVEGIDAANKTVATSIALTNGRYVPGSTQVHVLGTVADLRPMQGRISVGNLKIDTTTLNPVQLASIRVGSYVLISGIQPSPQGTLVGPVSFSVGGSGLVSTRSVGGSGFISTQSVGGSGLARKQSVGGSGLVSKQSVGGSGLVSKQSVGGSGLVRKQSVGGSGLVSKQSVGGSGLVSKQSVGGSGLVRKQSVGGSGLVSKQSVGGSGLVSKQSVGGSGLVSQQSVGGSGLVRNQSVGGSGLVNTQSVGGSGFISKQSVGGSGIALRRNADDATLQ